MREGCECVFEGVCDEGCRRNVGRGVCVSEGGCV